MAGNEKGFRQHAIQAFRGPKNSENRIPQHGTQRHGTLAHSPY